ncbi:MAG: bifunctional metallophosphatase/5'-nucleotidase [Oscillospiraceae bacterium]|nr:bifunctional metallophosphatase/5'-nucleotidase [Oscillospiraceae bacterium]
MAFKFKAGVIWSFICVLCIAILFIFFLNKYKENENTIVIYHTNDMHGALNSMYNENGTLVRIGADIVKTLKDNTKNSILLDAGDSTQGTSLASNSKGLKIYEIMKAAGWDFMALGNHEFDYGSENLLSNVSKANVTPIVSNIYNSDGSVFLGSNNENKRSVIKEIAGKKIGILGITTTETVHSTRKDNIKNLIFEEEIEAAKRQVNELKKQNVDLIVAITHVGNNKIAKNVDGIHIVIDGHSHEIYSKVCGNVFVGQAGSSSSNIGKFTIRFSQDGTHISHKIIKPEKLYDPLNPESLKILPDSKIKKMCDEELKDIEKKQSTVAGYTSCTLFGGNVNGLSVSRLFETNLGNLVADAILFEAQRIINLHEMEFEHVVALVNGGTIRKSIPIGNITTGKISEVLPFKDKVAFKVITPQKLYEVLENGVKNMYADDKKFNNEDTAILNVSGMRVEVNLNGLDVKFNKNGNKIKRNGSKVEKIVLTNSNGTDGKTLNRNDDHTQIIVCTPEFTANGGDYYIALRDARILEHTDFTICDITTKYIEYLGTIKNVQDQYCANKTRVKILNRLFGQTYKANIELKSGSNLLTNSKVKVRIDDQNEFLTTTDEKGNVLIDDLKSGPHSVAVLQNEKHFDAYFNNMLGITNAKFCLESDKIMLCSKGVGEINRAIFTGSSKIFWWLNSQNMIFKNISIFKLFEKF